LRDARLEEKECTSCDAGRRMSVRVEASST
jgi:hypothetical protein